MKDVFAQRHECSLVSASASRCILIGDPEPTCKPVDHQLLSLGTSLVSRKAFACKHILEHSPRRQARQAEASFSSSSAARAASLSPAPHPHAGAGAPAAAPTALCDRGTA